MTISSLKYELTFEMQEKSENTYFIRKKFSLKVYMDYTLQNIFAFLEKMSKKYRHLIYLLTSFIKCKAIGCWVGLTA